MAQVTIYLPDVIEKKARRAAKARHMPLSRWIADQLSGSLDDKWPQEVLDAAGAFPDFPSLEQIRKGYGKDARRESLE